MLQMDDALGTPGGARLIHPERHLVTAGVGFRELGGNAGSQFSAMMVFATA